MAEKKVPVSDQTHADIQRYLADYGIPSIKEALEEMVATAMEATADNRRQVSEARSKRPGANRTHSNGRTPAATP